MSKKRHRGGRISLTAREADLLFTVAATCGDYAPDSVEHTFIQPPISRDEASEMWDRIMEKIEAVTPNEVSHEH